MIFWDKKSEFITESKDIFRIFNDCSLDYNLIHLHLTQLYFLSNFQGMMNIQECLFGKIECTYNGAFNKQNVHILPEGLPWMIFPLKMKGGSIWSSAKCQCQNGAIHK